MEGSCGTCTMCCKLLGIKELEKKPGEWCGHCAVGKGCKIYHDRPPSCREYQCAYLMGFDQGIIPPLAMRPDKSRVVISPGMGTANDGTEIVTVHVDPGFRDNWKKEPVYGMLVRLALSGAKIVIGWDTGPTKKVMEATGPQTVGFRTVNMSAPDKDGKQWVTYES